MPDYLLPLGSDDYIECNLPFAEPSIRTLVGYHQAGIPIPDVLKWATINAAKQANYKGRLGVLKKGHIADIIAVSKDIETNIEALLKVHFVMKHGKIVRQ